MTAVQNTPGGQSGGPVLVGAHTDGSSGRSGTPAERFTSTDPAAFEIPTGREEQWRFTPGRPLRSMWRSLDDSSMAPVEVEAIDGVEVSAIGREHPLFGRVLTPADRISALAYAQVSQAVLIDVPAGVTVAEPIIVATHGENGSLSTRHVIVNLGAGSSASVVFDSTGSAELAGNVELNVGDGATLSSIFVTDWDHDAIEVSAHAALVGRDATLHHTVVNLGGSLVRISPSVSFAGPGATANLDGVCFAGADQHHEVRLYVDHNQPDCTSDVLYKNALDGQSARTVWIGDVRIRPNADNTRTFELNRNLVLSNGARADSVPNLEIETGEIAGAGHASATGRFDDLQLFYLQARGIPESEARRLVVRGFFADVINRIGVPALQERLMNTIEARLGGGVDAKESS
jgi:Fe-S cluster assembly protein SufD